MKSYYLLKTELNCTPACKNQKQNAIPPITPTLNLTQTVTLALRLTLILTQAQNLNSNTSDNNLKSKRVNEQMSTQSCSLILLRVNE